MQKDDNVGIWVMEMVKLIGMIQTNFNFLNPGTTFTEMHVSKLTSDMGQ